MGLTMPQDELWKTSARLTGYVIKLELAMLGEEYDTLWLTPTWSKTPPSSRDGGCVVATPTFMRDFLPQVMKAGHHELLAGSAKHVPSVIRHEMRAIQDGFSAGVLH